MVSIAAAPRTSARPGTLMALGSMSCVQLGLALSVHLLGEVGPLRVVWLRLAWAAAILLVAVRPRPWRFRRPVLLATVALGIVTAGLTMLFMAAVARLPLGTASALEFLGPLGVAVARGGGRRSLLWPGLAAAGVLLLTHPWLGSASPAGIACALGAAICWAGYIMLTQAVGDEVAGLQGLAVSITVAALSATLVSGPSVTGVLTPHLLLAGFGLALLVPVIPFSLEMSALRRLTTSAFGTLMCLEPAIALVAGFALLGQVPRAWSLAGVAFVITAGLGAERYGARTVELPVACGPLDRLSADCSRPGLCLGRRGLPGASQGPATARERALCELFAQVLGIAQVGVDDSFFDLGGHSLLAAVLVARLMDQLSIKISLKTFMSDPTVRAIDRYLDQ